jgi:hypothetical protein
MFFNISEQSHVLPQEPFSDLLEKIMPIDIMIISIEKKTIVDMKVAIT